MKLFNVDQMIEAEKAADAAGHSYAQMMETAGQRTAEAIMERVPVQDANVLILVGPGNNGGDGLVAGRYLAEAGANVALYMAKPRDAAADENFANVQEMGLFVVNAEFDQRFRVLRTRLNITDILVDALLGTGVSRPISGALAQLLKQVQAGIKELNAKTQSRRENRPLVTLSPLHPATPDRRTPSPSHPFIVAVDCPSGLNCNSGELDPLALDAHLTVTFAGPKGGHFLFPGAGACGELVVADIGIDETLDAVQAVKTEVATDVLAKSLLPPRPADGHKGTFGKVLIVGGSERYQGAPVLSARGAFRAGAGLVGLFVPRSLRSVSTVHLPEATYPPVADDEQFSAASAEALLESLDDYDAMLVGPGLGDVPAFVDTLFNDETKAKLPRLLVDADGLNLLARHDKWHQRLPANSVLTPHPGEMSRLMGISLDELKGMNRIEVAQAQAQAWGQVVLLKGAHTVVAAANGRSTLIPFASPVLAVGGSGDVLGGVIVALLGQGMAPYEAAVLGAYLHGRVGATAAHQSGLLAHEIADRIPEIMTQLRS